MGFDADAYLKARTPWTLTLGGRTSTAAWLSVEQYQGYVAAVKEAGDDEAKLRIAVAAVLRLMFPWKMHYWWRDPVKQILALEAPIIGALLTDFFASWVESLRPLVSLMNGTGSKPSTATPSPAATTGS